jgi:hypothetical protein
MKACCVGFVRGRSQLPLVSVIFAIGAASLASAPSSMSFLSKRHTGGAVLAPVPPGG